MPIRSPSLRARTPRSPPPGYTLTPFDVPDGEPMPTPQAPVAQAMSLPPLSPRSISGFSEIQRDSTPPPTLRLHPFLQRPTIPLDLTQVPPSTQYTGWDSYATEPPVSKLYLIFGAPLPPRLIIVIRHSRGEPLQCHHVMHALAEFLTGPLLLKERQAFAIQAYERIRKAPTIIPTYIVPTRAMEEMKDTKYFAGATQPQNISDSTIDGHVLCIHFCKK
ncbi:hypothetical protein SISNIDRAFT_483030 [Sistotremastrum niveocremeum HHB9708]|uniref:Uncharacterized protein n=1 Tax=Sistotremastrum niveocremeum HHB9708 TaxID=1314777 RepID=A0A164Y0U4_9AGAM|nr:hypothetical protein SISNIDRAFT_483030 [Sistotremastrum niveocremeum HHB9708]